MTTETPLQIAIVGGHGQIARLLTTTLVGRGHSVRSLVRSEDQFDDIRADGGDPVVCDVEVADISEIETVFSASDVVVFAAGSGPDAGPDRKWSMDRDGALKSMDAAVRVAASRFVIISSMGADDPPQDDETFSVYLRAKHEADEGVRAASERNDIGHVIVRPGQLTDDDATGSVQVAEHTGSGKIPRADVAHVLAEIIDSGLGDGHTFEVISGSTPIVDALSALD
ncbi:MAG: SDR family oxidoreductase [Ilumatobacter sp.]|uniref:SDR family oxidoreductase n=1 Tax=Ilumatobacter sp. TaxID=1967498 RepID=UPI003296B152